MSYTKENTTIVTSLVETEEFKRKFRTKEQDFTRNRKMGIKEIVMYELNKKGLSSKMEIFKFQKLININEISAPAVLKQREKLKSEAFEHLRDESLKLFYTKYKKEVKTYKGYIPTAIDGVDFEIPNTKANREKYNGNQKKHCARLTVSNMYDLLNKYVLDTIIEKYDYSEKTMAKTHQEKVKGKTGKYKTIRIMDRGYPDLSSFYHDIKEDDKFLVRLRKNDYKNEIDGMKSNDEIIGIGYEYNRIKYYKTSNPDVYEYFKSGQKLSVRVIKVELAHEMEILLTNLDFSYEEIIELYKMRWGIETAYHYLKESLKIEAITSSKPILIEQDIYSQILVYNILQSFINEEEAKINQTKYKNEMKINVNMAIGIFKEGFILALLEDEDTKRGKIVETICNDISKYIVPIKPGRSSPRNKNRKNKYHYNKRKSF